MPLFPPASRQAAAPLALLLALVPLHACTREAPSTASMPALAGAPPPPPAALSRFSVPLAYDFSSMLALVERAVPKTLGSIDSVRTIGTDTRRHYAFEARRGPFTAYVRGREVFLRSTIAYRARGFYKPLIGPTLSAGCGDEQHHPRIVLELATPLALTETWHLSSRARLVQLVPASKEQNDRCDVGILNTDVTDRVIEAARGALTERLPAIDRKVAEVDLQPQFREWWSLLARPIQLGDGVWLMLGPERLRMGRVSGRERTLIVPVTLDARPRIVTGREAPVVPPAGLPALGHDSASSGFHILLDGAIDYGSASSALTAAFASKVIEQAGRKIRVGRVRVTPADKGQLALALDFTGDAKGTLSLLGTPVYDTVRRELTVPDLDYALSVNDRLVGTYAWLRDDKLRALFRERAHFPVQEALEKGRALLLAGLNRRIGDAVTLSATVDRVAVKGLFVTRDAVVVRGEATGQAAVAVKQ